MQSIKIYPGKVSGRINAPPSKSESIRALAAALLCRGTTVIRSLSQCDDVKAALSVIKSLGADLSFQNNLLTVESTGELKGNRIYCNESGLCARLFPAICASSGREFIITGKGWLLERPMDMVEQGLHELGAFCESSNGRLPINLRGPIKPGKYILDGSITSQFISGCLFILPLLQGDSVLRLRDLKSRGYVYLTIGLLEKFGIIIDLYTSDRYVIKGGQAYRPASVDIEGDWSGAAFMLVAGAVAGEALVEGLDINTRQPDRMIIDVLKQAGAGIEIREGQVVSSKKSLKAFEFNAEESPDIVPPLIALAANCKGNSMIQGVSRLAYKESNRLNALISEFSKLGIEIFLKSDDIMIKGGTVKSGKVSSHNDHRIAMALAVAALNANGPVEIENPACVGKSYPDFFGELESIKN